MEQEIIAPSINLLESMRSVGYTLEAAVADLIDNSISANATFMSVDVDVVNGQFLALLDDGVGMSPERAREALRFAGSVGDRAESDLGRFGLGLKTASLSQSRCLTVVTKQGNSIAGLRWDIDHVRETGQWSLLVLDAEELNGLPLINQLTSLASGTLIVWQNLDLLVGDAPDPGAYLAQRLSELRESLSLHFHRFLSGTGRLLLSVNGIVLGPVDPFLSGNPKTQRTQTESISLGGSTVEVTAFTLPHPSALTAVERQRSDLGDGMRNAQGLYIYRNRRLISYGHWHGVSRMSELSKQTRIQVDVPTSLDNLWQLDIKKSRAEPPHSIRQYLRRIINPVLERGHRVHTFRGRQTDESKVTHIWSKHKTRDGVRYEINVEHPLISAMLCRLSTDDERRVRRVLETIADTYPALDVYQEIAGDALPQTTQVSEDQILGQLREIYMTGLLGSDIFFVAATLAKTEPFNMANDLLRLVNIAWKENNGVG